MNYGAVIYAFELTKRGVFSIETGIKIYPLHNVYIQVKVLTLTSNKSNRPRVLRLAFVILGFRILAMNRQPIYCLHFYQVFPCPI